MKDLPVIGPLFADPLDYHAPVYCVVPCDASAQTGTFMHNAKGKPIWFIVALTIGHHYALVLVRGKCDRKAVKR